MKKIIFSLVCVLAFSGVSFAQRVADLQLNYIEVAQARIDQILKAVGASGPYQFDGPLTKNVIESDHLNAFTANDWKVTNMPNGVIAAELPRKEATYLLTITPKGSGRYYVQADSISSWAANATVVDTIFKVWILYGSAKK